ncbi:hypothetical protein pb186bvf_020278 [Paramecium bursaria]
MYLYKNQYLYLFNYKLIHIKHQLQPTIDLLQINKRYSNQFSFLLIFIIFLYYIFSFNQIYISNIIHRGFQQNQRKFFLRFENFSSDQNLVMVKLPLHKYQKNECLLKQIKFL